MEDQYVRVQYRKHSFLFIFYFFPYILSTSTSFHIFNVKMHTDHYIYKNQLAL